MDASRLLEVLLDIELEFEDGLACTKVLIPPKDGIGKPACSRAVSHPRRDAALSGRA